MGHPRCTQHLGRACSDKTRYASVPQEASMRPSAALNPSRPPPGRRSARARPPRRHCCICWERPEQADCCHENPPALPCTRGPLGVRGCCFPPDVIVLAVRWYLRFGLSYRDVEELLAERGVHVGHVTVDRWVQRFTPLLAMATAEEVVGTDHGEAHRVLVAISHSAGGASRMTNRSVWVAAYRAPSRGLIPRPPRRHQVPMRFVRRRPAVGCLVGSMPAPLLRPT
jgi:hypothetical protein